MSATYGTPDEVATAYRDTEPAGLHLSLLYAADPGHAHAARGIARGHARLAKALLVQAGS